MISLPSPSTFLYGARDLQENKDVKLRHKSDSDTVFTPHRKVLRYSKSAVHFDSQVNFILSQEYLKSLCLKFLSVERFYCHTGQNVSYLDISDAFMGSGKLTNITLDKDITLLSEGNVVSRYLLYVAFRLMLKSFPKSNAFVTLQQLRACFTTFVGCICGGFNS